MKSPRKSKMTGMTLTIMEIALLFDDQLEIPRNENTDNACSSCCTKEKYCWFMSAAADIAAALFA